MGDERWFTPARDQILGPPTGVRSYVMGPDVRRLLAGERRPPAVVVIDGEPRAGWRWDVTYQGDSSWHFRLLDPQGFPSGLTGDVSGHPPEGVVEVNLPGPAGRFDNFRAETSGPEVRWA